jgi:hypothetical protein
VQASQVADVTVQLSLPTTNGMRKIEVHNAGPAAAEILTVMYLDSDGGGPAPDTRAWQELNGPLLAGQSRGALAGLTGSRVDGSGSLSYGVMGTDYTAPRPFYRPESSLEQGLRILDACARFAPAPSFRLVSRASSKAPEAAYSGP